MPITVAIANYNGLEFLPSLIDQLKTNGFNDIYVLDDASTDQSVKWLRQQSDIKLVAGQSNLGPTGNRNRILGQPTGDIILFLDVDMSLIGTNIAHVLEQEFSEHPQVAILSSLVLSLKDEPIWYNWGYEAGPRQDGLVEGLNTVALEHWDNPDVMATVRRLAQGKVGHFEPVQSREVDWVIEQFFAVRADVFRKLDGFDPAFKRFHEGPDFCLRARRAGHKVRFTDTITAKHLDQHTGTDEDRAVELRTSTKYYYQKHYGIPDEIIERFFLW